METQEMENKTHRKLSSEFFQPDPTPSTPFLEIDDFTDYVAFHIKCDLIEHGSSTIDEKVSRKKCRFCD